MFYFEDPINYQDGTSKLDEILNEVSFSIKQDSLNTIKNIKKITINIKLNLFLLLSCYYLKSGFYFVLKI